MVPDNHIGLSEDEDSESPEAERKNEEERIIIK